MIILTNPLFYLGLLYLSKLMFRKLLTIATVLSCLSLLSGCYTIYGAAKDLESTGKFVQSKLVMPRSFR
jgi:predicted small secreted protein